MAHAERASKRKRGRVALPILGAAGASFAMGGSTSATMPIASVPSQDNAPLPEITLYEEKFLTSTWRRSMSSTRKTREHPTSSKKFSTEAAEAAQHAAAEAAQREAAEAVQHEAAEAAVQHEAAEAVQYEAAEAAQYEALPAGA